MQATQELVSHFFATTTYAEAQISSVFQCSCFVFEARGFTVGGQLVATSGASKVETGTSNVEAGKRDEEARGAAKGGGAGGC